MVPRYNRAVLFNTPLTRFINIGILLLLIAGAGVIYWFAWRPLPETSGEVTAPIAADATITRDGLGVPHITAGSWQDALFLQGFATAQDRMWQMDALRRLAAGQLSEVMGETTLESDRDARRWRLDRLAEAQEQNLPAETREAFVAYARGVNYYLETHQGNLPLEFTLLKYEPRPWRVHDSLLVGMEMYRNLTDSWRQEVQKMRMLEKGDPDKVSRLFPLRTGTEVLPGSNAWAISGAHTATGKPLLASDPHLAYSFPSPWHMVHLKAPNLNVTGVALVGIPAVIIGHNENVAWGMTNLEYDGQDLYREQINAQGRYLYRGNVTAGQVESDVLPVKDGDSVGYTTLVTGHGPIFLTDGNQQFALEWSAAAVTQLGFPFLAMARSSNWTEFEAALRGYNGPPQNVVFAAKDGTIAYHVAGMVPIRPEGCHGDVPADGSTGDCNWQGFIPFDQLPQVVNPESGIIATANNNPFPEEYPYPVAGVFAPPYRAREIRNRLGSKDGWKVEEMVTVQKDVYSMFDHFLAQETVKAFAKKPSGSAQMREAIEALRNWNGQMEEALAAPLMVTLEYEKLRNAIAEVAAPGLGQEYGGRMAPQVVESLLRERPEGWVADWDQLLVESLASALGEGEKAQGSNVARWDYGQAPPLTIQHPVFSQLPFVGRYLNAGPTPRSGGPWTIKQMTGRLGPSFRMAVNFADLDASVANITIGESDHPLSSHYKDQWDTYRYGRTLPMPFSKVDGETLTVRAMK